MRRRRSSISLLALAITCAGPAFAQNEEDTGRKKPGLEAKASASSATPAPDVAQVGSDELPSDLVVVPVPLNIPVAPIAETESRVEIILEIVIDAEGHVIEARAVNGSEPHASGAVASTRSWSFRPATKGGQPVPAKISFLVTYDPPARVEAPSEGKQDLTAPAPDMSPASAEANALAEVVILGDLPNPGARGFTRDETRNLAGAFDDPLRSIEVLPGVSPIVTGLPMFFVRGAPPGNVGFFIDGIRVPQLYHGFLGPSVVNPAFIERIDLHGGPAPVNFGRYAGAVVNVDLASPKNELRAEGTVRLLDAGGFAESPFADGRGYAMIGGRYSYTALLLSLISPEQELEYWDYQGLVGYRLGKKDELSLFAFGSYDYVGANLENEGGSEFHRIDARYKHDFSRRANVRIAGTYGFDRTRSDAGFVTDHSAASRINYQFRADDVVVRAGGDVTIDNYDLDLDPAISEPEVYLTLFPPRTDGAGGLFVDLVLFPEGAVRVIPGVRADVYSSLGEIAVGVDPRIAAEYDLTPYLKASHAIGVAHQTPNFVPNVPGAQAGGLGEGLQESLQFETSYEASLPWEVTASVGFFLNGTQHLTDPFGLSQTLSIDETSTSDRAFGRAYGIEVYMKRPLTRRIGGLLSYTYTKTLRSFGPIETAPGYDRPHVFNLAMTYDIGAHWQASGKFAIASGIPGRVTTLDGFIYDTDSRSRPLARLDLKLQKRWYVTKDTYWAMYGEVLNSTFSPTVARRVCTVDGCADQGTAPIVIPNIGAEFSFR